jgi:hypothetical protein
MRVSHRLLKATEDYANGWSSWEEFHAVLETDFYYSTCGGRCKPCSREWAARQLPKMRRRRAEQLEYEASRAGY